MSLLQLPPELKLNIIERLDPESSLHFALTSRNHSKLCQDVLREHTRLFAQHSILETTDVTRPLWAALGEILQDPRKAWYVTELNLTSQRNDDTIYPGSEDNLSFYKAAAQQLVPLYPYDRTFFAAERDDDIELFGDDWDNLVEIGAEEVTIILLIHHLPRLRTFRMTIDSRAEGYLEMFMRRVAAGYQDPALAPRMPLQHLKVAAIAHWDSEGSCNVDWAIYFLCVPSLRTFAGWSMGSEGVMTSVENSEAHLRTTKDAPISNVEGLKFDNCQFDTQSLHVVLPLIKNLKRFSYQAGSHTVSFSDYEPRRVIDALATHAGHSLEEAELLECQIGYTEGENDIPLTSLRGFKTLKALHCETRWLIRSQDTDLGDDEALSQGFHSVEDLGEAVADPRDNLPESLEELYLEGIYEDEEWEQLVELFEISNTSTPKLTFEKTCLMRSSTAWNSRSTQEKFGGAAEPASRFGNPLYTQIWVNHGYS